MSPRKGPALDLAVICSVIGWDQLTGGMVSEPTQGWIVELSDWGPGISFSCHNYLHMTHNYLLKMGMLHEVIRIEVHRH